MTERSGWIKLHRALEDTAIMTHPGMLQLWIHCLFKAARKPCQVRFKKLTAPIQLQRGEFVTGRTALHSDLYPNGLESDPTSMTVWRWLESLEESGSVSIRTVLNRCSIVKVVNYDYYQSSESTHLLGDSADDKVKPSSQRDKAGGGKECAEQNDSIEKHAVDRAGTGKRSQHKKLFDDRVTTEGTESEASPTKKPETSKKPKGDALAAIIIPEVLNTPEFCEAWLLWVKYRNELKKPLTTTGSGTLLTAR